MNDVIESCKYHQHYDDRETNPEAHFLRAFRQRAATHRFDRIEQKETAIEQGNRKQVEEPDGDRKYGSKMDEGDEAHRRHLSRYLRYPDRSAELVGRFTADNDATDIGERSIDDEPCFLRSHPNRLRRRYRLEFQILRRH